MEAYSLDLRERVVAACEEGARSQAEVAADFAVSGSFVTKLLARWRATGSAAALPRAGGVASAIGAAADGDLRALVKGQPDATLAELSARLADRGHAARSAPVLCRALARLGLPRKKRRPTRPSATPPASAAGGRRSGGGSGAGGRRGTS